MNRSVDDFLNDPDFVRWVLHPTKTGILYWEKWQKANPKGKDNLLKAREIILSLDYDSPEADESRYHRILENIIQHSSQSPVKEQTNVFKLPDWKWVAASVVIIISIVSLLNLEFEPSERITQVNAPTQITKFNPDGRKSTITLPDSSIVHLNSSSQIAYGSNFLDNRVIELSGEAFFEVRHNQTSAFRVRSGEVTTTALGTSFNVQAYPNEDLIKVSLKEGKVKINSQVSESLLNPGKAFQYEKSSMDINTLSFDPEKEFAWIDGILVLEENDLNGFINKIERWYGVEVMVMGQPGQEWRINGKFKNMSLQLVMESVSFAKGIDFKINNNELILYFN